MDYIQYFEPLEKARESGDIDQALLLSQKALLDAALKNDGILAVNAYGHQLLIFKDQFTKTGDEFYLHLMHSVAASGLQLAEDLGVTGQSVAVMHLRAGDYFFHYKKYPEALGEMEKAIQNLGDIEKEKPGEYAEYLSHLGKAQAFAGKIEEGVSNLEKAVEMTSGETELRGWHQKVVHSGNLARLALVFLQIGEKDKAVEIAKLIYPIALDLKDNHNMPIRWEELQKALQKYNISLT